MKKAVNILNHLVFAAAMLAIIGMILGVVGMVYEALLPAWLSFFVPVVITMDCLFLLSTLVNLFFFRKNETILSFSIVSLILIAIAFVMKGIGNYYFGSLVVLCLILFRRIVFKKARDQGIIS